MSSLSFMSTRGQHHWSPELTWDPSAAHTLPVAGTLNHHQLVMDPASGEPSGETPVPADTLAQPVRDKSSHTRVPVWNYEMTKVYYFKLPSLSSSLPRNI